MSYMHLKERQTLKTYMTDIPLKMRVEAYNTGQDTLVAG